MLNKKNEQFYQFLERLVTTLSEPQSNALLVAVLTFLHGLIEISEINSTYRTIQLGANDLSLIVNWAVTAGETVHPLRELKRLSKEDDNFSFDIDACNTLDIVLKKLEECAETTDVPEILEPSLASATGIVKQFSTRAVFVLIDDYNENAHANYWLTEADDATFEAQEDNVTCDLTDVIKNYLPADVNVTSDCKRLLHLSASPQSNRERTTTAPCFRTRRVEVEPSTGRPEKKIYGTLIRNI